MSKRGLILTFQHLFSQNKHVELRSDSWYIFRGLTAESDRRDQHHVWRGVLRGGGGVGTIFIDLTLKIKLLREEEYEEEEEEYEEEEEKTIPDE